MNVAMIGKRAAKNNKLSKNLKLRGFLTILRFMHLKKEEDS